jgi:hypothetical protein
MAPLPYCSYYPYSPWHAALISTRNLRDTSNSSDCLPGSRFFGNQLWEIPAKNAFGRIKMRNKDLCLDAGNTPLQNGRGLKLWTW